MIVTFLNARLDPVEIKDGARLFPIGLGLIPLPQPFERKRHQTRAFGIIHIRGNLGLPINGKRFFSSVKRKPSLINLQGML